MPRTFIAMVGTPGVTVCTFDGTPYRPDNAGIVYVLAEHQTELTARGWSTATAAQLRTGGHGSEATTCAGENYVDHG